MPSTSASDPAQLALVLTIRTRSGPRVVFHYPAQPNSEINRLRHSRRVSFESLSSFSSESATEDTTVGPSDSEDELKQRDRSASGSSRRAVTGAPSHSRAESSGGTTSRGKPGAPTNKAVAGRKTRTLREEGPEDYQDDYDDGEITSPRGVIAAGLAAAAGVNGTGSRGGSQLAKDGTIAAQVGWDNIFEYPASALGRLLCPGRSAKKKRFEVEVGDLTFLGYPTFVREDGHWRKKRGPRKSRGQASDAAPDGVEIVRRDKHDNRLGEELGRSTGSQAILLGAGSSTSQTALSEPASEAKSTSSGGEGSEMSMYNVVFVMNPGALEHQRKVTDMYENVVKKFAKALKYEQARTGYVWTESRRILDMKSKAREENTHISILWPETVAASPLAKSIAHIFTTISASKIAHVSIGETVDTSMQIPQIMSTAFASTPGDPQTLGLWVTTASMLEDDGTLSPHAALLLLEDKETLLKEIEGDKRELAAPLSYFIREVTPTKSLQKMAIRLSLRLPDLQFLARHLIYWRRARAIPPLHIRDIYMVSPLADMRLLSEAAEIFERKFPGLPGLTQILQSLSSRPLPYGYLIPSQDHKPVYMEILAWLLRGNWVTQLRTFAWVRVAPEIKAKAALQTKKDEHKGSIKGRSSKRDSETSGRSGFALERRMTNDSISEEGSLRAEKSAIADHRSPRLRPVIDASRSDAGSTGSYRTALHGAGGPGPGRSPLIQVNRYENMTTPSINGKTTEVTDDASALIPPLELSAPEPSIILSPQRASTEESRWLSLIRDSLSEEDLRSSWSTLNVYFDGKWALEDVAAREGMKRSRVANLVARLEREGVLCIARHW